MLCTQDDSMLVSKLPERNYITMHCITLHNKSNRTTMRPLGIYLIGISMYILILDYDLLSDDFGQFRRFFLNGNGRTDTTSYRDATAHLKSRF